MYDIFFKHFLSVLFTSILIFCFWGGWIAGANDWPLTWLVFIPIYAFVYARFKG